MRKVLNKYSIIILSLYAVWILGIPFIYTKTVPIVCNRISAQNDYVLEVKKPILKLSPIPVAKLEFGEIVFRSKNTDGYAKIADLNVNIRLLPILSGKFHINDIFLGDLVINNTLKKNFILDKDFFKYFYSNRLKVDKIYIKNIGIKIRPSSYDAPVILNANNLSFLKDSKKIIMGVNSDIAAGEMKSKAKIKLYLPQNNDIKKSNVEILLENFALEPLGKYLKNFLPIELVDMKGVINIQANKQTIKATFDNCAYNMKDKSKSVIFPKKLDVVSKFNITSKKISFENIDIISNGISASINGTISDYLKPTIASVNLNTVLNRSKVEDIVNILPPIKTEDLNIYKMKLYKCFGDVIGNFSIKGNLLEPDVNGDVFVNNVILSKPIKNAKGAIIKLKFLGKYLMYDVDVPAGIDENVWVKGGVELYNVKYSEMRIWSTKNVDLEVAEDKVVPLHEILNFVVGPVPIMDIKGRGNIDIKVKGNRANPHIWGGLNFYNVETFFKEMPDIVLKNANAKLIFDDENALFNMKSGTLNGKTISINGNCKLDGTFDFDVSSKFQEITPLYRALKTSKMVPEISEILPDLDVCNGIINLSLKVFGSLIDVENIQFNKNFYTKGNIELINNDFGLKGALVHDTSGNINFDGLNFDTDIKSFLGSSQLFLKGNIKNNKSDILVLVPKLSIKDILFSDISELKKDIGNFFFNVKLAYKGDIKNIELNKINLTADVIENSNKSKFTLSSGKILLNNNVLKISNLKGALKDFGGNIFADLYVSDVFDNPKANGNIKLNNFDIKYLNLLTSYSFIPQNLRQIKFEKGIVNLNSRIRDNKLNSYSSLDDITLVYKPLELPINILNGNLIVHNNVLNLNKINLLADEMPILLDGNIYDLFSKQNFDIYINSKPQQDFIDKYINKNQIYPVKIKGDIVYALKLKGNKDNFNLKANVDMSKDSSIYHLGATVGDVENAIVLNLDTRILKQKNMKIKEFSYDKIISSLGSRQTRLNMLKAKGGIEVYPDDLLFQDLCIKTENPTDARIFNIIFRKPNIKQGQFTSDLKLNGHLSNPTILGDFHIFETNIPFLDTMMKNITLKFDEKNITLSSKGEVLGNDITISGILKNRLVMPYQVKEANIYTKLLDLNYIVDKIKLAQLDNMQALESLGNFDISSFVVENLNLNAENINLKNLIAKNFEANVSLNSNKELNVKDFKLNLANGILQGNFKYNLSNNDSAINLRAENIDANDLTYTLFDLNNQIYGDLTGDISLTCNGTDFENCMRTLNGKSIFNVSTGRLPKLGSLEYLLKAGNLLKGGITNISINSVIDLITPLKTGEFSNITGNIVINKGMADNIEIKTQGKDLSLFISGNYDFSSSEAEMEVLGMLSKKISTMFGPIGNLSLNTLFNSIPGIDLSKNSKMIERINKIPGIELSSKAYRKFVADIKGNINGEDYVASFKWIN